MNGVVSHNGRHLPTFYKDPDEQLDYWVSWGEWLTDTAQIVATEWLIEPDGFFTVVQDDLERAIWEVTDDDEVDEFGDPVVLETYTDLRGVVISGGTNRNIGKVTCRITTQDGTLVLSADRTFKVKVQER